MSLPLSLDTNVLVRLLVNDDLVQAEQAAALIDASAGGSGQVCGLVSGVLLRLRLQLALPR